MSRLPASKLTSTESRILEAAGRLFYARGYHATTMRELAAEVGIQAPSLYNHFPQGKEEILIRICLDVARDFYEGALSISERLVDVSERLRELICWQVVYEAEHPYSARVADAHVDTLNPHIRRQFIQLRDAYEQLIYATLLEGHRQRIWRLSHPRVMCVGIVNMCKIDAWYKDDGPLSAQQIGDLYATFTLRALESGVQIQSAD
jgi:TetR/AcrR family transcriptional regulator, cholesterol catabolism regulator